MMEVQYTPHAPEIAEPLPTDARLSSLSCLSCRRRKVKCDHRKPICSACDRHGQECVWAGRKRSRPRKDKTLFNNVTSRLSRIELLVKDLQHPRLSEQAQESHFVPTDETVPMSVTADDSTRAGISPVADPPQPDPDSTSPLCTASFGPRQFAAMGGTDSTIDASGSCFLFSATGIGKIDSLIGDKRFSEVAHRLQQQITCIPPRRNLNCIPKPADCFPSPSVIKEHMNGFFLTLNRNIKFFDETAVRTAIHSYLHGQPQSGIGWKVALYTILLPQYRKQDLLQGTREHERFLYNAMALIPTAILQPPCPMSIGALLLLVWHLIFTAESHIAVSFLSLATQSLLLDGYYHNDHFALIESETQHRRRLFWLACIFDRDLMLRIGKPPLIGDHFLINLPEQSPLDRYGLFDYPDGVVLNYFRQKAQLAQIQGRIYSRLYSNIPAPAELLEYEVGMLDKELQHWLDDIPKMIRPMQPGAPLNDDNHGRMIALTSLHLGYFQLVVAIHSAALNRSLTGQDPDIRRPSAAICLNAARGAVSLLNYHHIDHPFTLYLLYQVAWCVDILFVNIIENKASPIAQQDIQLIKLVLLFYERYDANHQRTTSYYIIKALYEVALSVVSNPQSTFQDPLGAGNGLTLNARNVGDAATHGPIHPISRAAEQWEGISHGSHNWLSAGVLQMVDWSLSPSADS